MKTYQEIYPSAPLLRSGDVVRPEAGALLTLEYFEADPDVMPKAVFRQHHVLINLADAPLRVENWRDGAHRDFQFGRNEIVVTPAGVESGWRWHEKSRCIVITLDPERLERFAERELGVLLTERQLADLPQFEDADIAAAAVLVLESLRTRSIGSDVMFESLARVFLVKLVQRYGDQRGPDVEFSKRFTARHYKRVLDFVAAHYMKPIAIEDIAREAGLSASHFSRLFRQTVGDSPHQFLMRYRVERAQGMLREKERAMIDIALACGFSDQPHFTRAFKQIVGETPAAWRRTL